MHRRRRFSALAAALLALGAGPAPDLRAGESVRLDDAFPGVTFDRPIDAAQPPDGTSRMFVAEQGGRIWIVDHPAPAPPEVASKRLFLDLSGEVSRRGNEEGLLGFAFHPGFAENRRLFVHHSAKYASSSSRRNVLQEVLASAADADVADVSARRTILEVPQPYENHNGGWVGFDAGGKLLVALGDGGSAGDPGDRAQNLASLLGKILRLDVDAPGVPYSVPADNPFTAREGARGEILAYGLRNPWRCSVDPATGALWAGDVGQDAWEEIDLVVPGGNYGWRRREGFHAYGAAGPAAADAPIDPVVEVPHTEGESITGGVVVRGGSVPALRGAYVFADFVTGRIWTLTDPYGTARRELLLDTNENLASFAVDRAGEVYVLSFSGRVLALRGGAPYEGPGLPETLSEVKVFADLRTARPVANALRYHAIAPLWSDGAAKSRFLVLPAGGAMAWSGTDALGVPVGTYAVKTFARAGERIETRVIRRAESEFLAATYRWRADGSDADRVDARTTATAGGGPWQFPGPDDCFTCHTESAGFLLGVTGRQLPARTLARWTRTGALAGAPPARDVARHAPPAGRGRIDARARSYLDANCSFCHRPDDPTNASLDLRATTPLEETGIFDAPPQHGDVGVADARIVAPGDPSRSTIVARLRTQGEGRMPALGTLRPDRSALRLVERWIRRLPR